MKISIITTIYKAEKDLPRLLESMMKQKSSELEFFLIDNGSPDRCGEICREYAERDPRFRVYTIRENIGYIRARNQGIQVCDGDYVGFCDSDDYLVSGGYDRAVEKIKETDCDLYITVYHTITDDHQSVNTIPYPLGLYEGSNIKEQLLPQAFGALPEKPVLHGFAWKQIFRRSLIVENNYSFMPALQPYEDQIFNIDVLNSAGRVYIDDNPIYNYIVNEQSITAKLLSEFDSRQQWNRIGLLYDEKKKRADNALEVEAYSNQMLSSVYSLVLSMAKQKIGTEVLAKRFSAEMNEVMVNEIVTKSSSLQSGRLKFIKNSLKNKKYRLMFFVVKAALKMKG